MAKSSAFAGGFDEATFRTAVLNTMLMGMPEDKSEQLTFCWRRSQTFTSHDLAGNPYDWTATPTTDLPGNPAIPDKGGDQALTVPYALEFTARFTGDANTSLGSIDTSRATVTLLDKDYDRIRTADYAVIGDTRYRLLFDAPPQGLFGVTVWTLFLEAEDSA
jgi:hypothetical protein